MRRSVQKGHRAGMAIPEWFAVVGGLGAILIFGVTQLGDTANVELKATTGTLIDPSKVPSRFKPKGNNGFGNGGADGSPNGFQDNTR